MTPPVTVAEAADTAAVVALLADAAKIAGADRALLAAGAAVIAASVRSRARKKAWRNLWRTATAVDGCAPSLAKARSGRLVIAAMWGCSRGGNLQEARGAYIRLRLAALVDALPPILSGLRHVIDAVARGDDAYLLSLPPGGPLHDLTLPCVLAVEKADKVIARSSRKVRLR